MDSMVAAISEIRGSFGRESGRRKGVARGEEIEGIRESEKRLRRKNSAFFPLIWALQADTYARDETERRKASG